MEIFLSVLISASILFILIFEPHFNVDIGRFKMSKRKIALLVVGFFVVVLFAISQKEMPKPTPTMTPQQQAIQTIPYRIIDTDEIRKYKMAYTVLVGLVNGRLPDEIELAQIANKLHSQEHENTFIDFYLPGMEIGAGAFATGHHNPKLKIIVNEWALPPQYKSLIQ